MDGVSAGQSGGIESRDRQESTPAMFELVSGSNGQLALTPVESSISATMHHAIDTDQVVIPSTQGNIKDMMNRWETNNLDLRTVVKEALQSGRLPLAVLQLQLLRQRESFSNDPEDVFSEVHEIGRSIVYDLLMKVM